MKLMKNGGFLMDITNDPHKISEWLKNNYNIGVNTTQTPNWPTTKPEISYSDRYCFHKSKGACS